MKEFITIENQNGPLEIIGGKYDSALLLNGEPIQFTFIREIGSTWRYQISKSISESDIIQDKKFSNFVKFGYLSDEPLSNLSTPSQYTMSEPIIYRFQTFIRH